MTDQPGCELKIEKTSKGESLAQLECHSADWQDNLATQRAMASVRSNLRNAPQEVTNKTMAAVVSTLSGKLDGVRNLMQNSNDQILNTAADGYVKAMKAAGIDVELRRNDDTGTVSSFVFPERLPPGMMHIKQGPSLIVGREGKVSLESAEGYSVKRSPITPENAQKTFNDTVVHSLMYEKR
jgi:hypothetical protein